jgi:hypothetical protein
VPLRFARGRVRAFFVSVPLLVVPALATSARGADSPSTALCTSAYENAQIFRQHGKLLAARERASACARDQCPEIARHDCARWAEELAREVPSVVVVGRDEADRDVPVQRVLVDGVPHPEVTSGRPFELDPGAHVFRLERADAPPVERAVTIYQGERDRVLRIPLPTQPPLSPAGGAATAPSSNPSPANAGSAPPPASSPPASVGAGEHASSASYALPVVVAGLSVASFVAAGYLGVTGRQQLSDLRTSCAPTCSDAQVDPVKTRLTLSDAALGVGIVGAALATYLFVRAASEHSSPPASSSPSLRRARIEVVPTRDGALAVIGGLF